MTDVPPADPNTPSPASQAIGNRGTLLPARPSAARSVEGLPSRPTCMLRTRGGGTDQVGSGVRPRVRPWPAAEPERKRWMEAPEKKKAAAVPAAAPAPLPARDAPSGGGGGKGVKTLWVGGWDVAGLPRGTTLAELRLRLPVPVRLLGGADDLVAACLGSPRRDA
jgi:hypothetical protein